MAYSMSDLLAASRFRRERPTLHIRVAVPPGESGCTAILHRVEGPSLKAEDTEELMRSITSEDHIQQVRERGRRGLRLRVR
jgi:hypothetical protein